VRQRLARVDFFLRKMATQKWHSVFSTFLGMAYQLTREVADAAAKHGEIFPPKIDSTGPRPENH
jgi:hypothetical protein